MEIQTLTLTLTLTKNSLNGLSGLRTRRASQRPASQRPIKVLSYLQSGLGYRDIIICILYDAIILLQFIDDNQSISCINNQK